MVNIKCNRKKLLVTAKGHAQSAEKGSDLVCSAVSILLYTLASNVQDLAACSRDYRRPRTKLDEGDAEVSISPVHGGGSVATLVFDSVCKGFELLSKDYPENVKFTVI